MIRERLHVGARAGVRAGRGAWAALRWPVFSATSYRMVTDLHRQQLDPRFIVDVGANRGQFTTAVLEVFRRSCVVAFEPIPEAAAHLRELSARWPDRLVVIEAAVGSRAGEAELVVNRHSQSSSLRDLLETHLQAFPSAIPVRRVRVETVRLDDALADHAFTEPALLKVDVQGFEEEVLAGATECLQRFTHVILEASMRPLYSGERTFLDLLRAMDARGFAFMRPVGQLAHPETGEILQVDALFKRRESP